MNLKDILKEMDSEGHTGDRDSPIRLGGPETTVGPKALRTPRQVARSALDVFNNKRSSKDKDTAREALKAIVRQCNDAIKNSSHFDSPSPWLHPIRQLAVDALMNRKPAKPGARRYRPVPKELS